MMGGDGGDGGDWGDGGDGGDTMGDGTDTMQRAADGTSLLVTNQAFDFPHCSRLKTICLNQN